MNIGIIGTGRVGSTLATGLSDRGHNVMLGSREPTQPRLLDWVAQDRQHRQLGDRHAAVKFGEMVIVAVPGRSLQELLDIAGRDSFSGKIVIDATNPFGKNERGDTIDIFGEQDSGAEFLQRELPRASVVKAFNEVLAPEMLHPEQASEREMRIAGNDRDAKRRVAELIESLGWPIHDIGGLEEARWLEHAVIDRFSYA